MSSGEAIVIGAGVGATVSLAAQFVGDRLATARDRRSQRRERLHGVITEAVLALYTSSRREPVTEEEFAQFEPEPSVLLIPRRTSRSRPTQKPSSGR